MRRILIFGAGGYAELAHYYFSHDSDHEVVAFTVDGEYVEDPSYKGLPVVPFEEVPRRFPPAEFGMFVAVGLGQVNQLRARKVAETQAAGYTLCSFVSSKASTAADFVARPNTMVMEHCFLHPFVHIGFNTVVWANTRIGFHTQIGDHCWLVAPIFGESVQVGDYSFVGLNATIAPRRTIGKSNVIGAGALILEDTKDGAVYKGVASTVSAVPSSRLRYI